MNETISNPLPGLEPGKVFLVDHDPRWSALFEQEARRIAARLGDVVVAIEHYGSTSIPGIKAKPVIDLLIGLRHLDDALSCEPAMAELGYDFARLAGVPDHHVFGKARARTHLAHFAVHGGASWKACLAFRDALRADIEKARAYERLKVGLAARHADDRAAYTAGKGAFVTGVVAAAFSP